MEYLSKSARRVLDVFRHTEPNYPGGRYYFVAKMQFPTDLDFNEVEACLLRLEEAHLIAPVDTNRFAFKLTDQGRHWPEYSGQERLDTFLKSVLCPLVVSLLTNAVIHGLPALLKLLSALVQKNPS